MKTKGLSREIAHAADITLKNARRQRLRDEIATAQFLTAFVSLRAALDRAFERLLIGLNKLSDN